VKIEPKEVYPSLLNYEPPAELELPENFEPRQRVSSPGLDRLLGHRFPVGSSGGFVEARDYMGSDESIVSAARTSTSGEAKSEKADRQLIRHMLRNRHDTPFEFCTLTLRILIDMATWRQFVRHRLLSVSEYSTRYMQAYEGNVVTAPHEWRTQAADNRQGSSGYLDSDSSEALASTREERQLLEQSRTVYQNRLDRGIARELARKDLPLSTFTLVTLEMDLRGWLHFSGLRLDGHAQLEIRQYASVIAGLLRAWCPVAWEAYEDYQLGALRIGKFELELLEQLTLVPKAPCEMKALLVDRGIKPKKNGGGEFDELVHKCGMLGRTSLVAALEGVRRQWKEL
jgi:thymidylate synthase (FAD)